MLPRGLNKQRGEQRDDDSRGEPLHNAERDQASDVPGKSRQQGAEHKQEFRGEIDGFSLKPPNQPARKRDGDPQGQHIAGDDPLHRIQRGVKVPAEMIHRDIHHGGVQHGGDRARHQHQGNAD